MCIFRHILILCFTLISFVQKGDFLFFIFLHLKKLYILTRRHFKILIQRFITNTFAKFLMLLHTYVAGTKFPGGGQNIASRPSSVILFARFLKLQPL